MFLKQNVNTLQDCKIIWKSNWFAQDSFNYKRHIYEDIFIRKYVSSFFFKWSKFFTYKILGSIYLIRTYGQLNIIVYFFFPILKQKLSIFKRKNKLKQIVSYKNSVIKPVNKYKKHLTIILFFYQLEKILKVQIFFKFRNICTGLINSKLTTTLMLKMLNYLTNKFIFLKYQFKEEIYLNTLMFLINLFKFKTPDGELLANYISSVFFSMQKHTQFLMFVKRVLITLKKVFKFTGIKILISGKLNGFSRAQSKQIQVGCVPLQSFKIPYVEGYSHAFTSAGKIGIKVWIC